MNPIKDGDVLGSKDQLLRKMRKLNGGSGNRGPSMEAMTRRSLLLGIGIVMTPMALMMPLVILVHLWGRRGPIGLSYTASMVGEPLSMDMITEDTCNDNLGIIGFAKVLIQGDAARKLPDMVRVRVPTEENIEPKAMSVRVDF
ncbi:hypothetical protein Patl1_20604 [Pistacia atlantica]|uniref:Uncharacterized protein n=1 Tax=Pistacia atlantica TaxID=434234 RepID=A0ACC1BJI0_9ROSI|nr:hypothetical protein Patl1_20604 [Pistacia atlantica]